MPSIYYFCPDFTPPSAGTRRIYRHVFHLNRLGFKAAIMHQKRGFVLTWHGYRVPVTCIEAQPIIKREDILVFPEGMAGLMKQTQNLPCKRIALVLNWAYVYLNLPVGENWKDYGIRHAITPSPFIKNFLEWGMGLEVTLIGNYVDTEAYHYDPSLKIPKISYMARKDLSGEILNAIFRRKESPAGKYRWIYLKDLDEETYGNQVLESRIFLATSTQEGMPTSILEAMAAGCLVLGFSGMGGEDYMVGNGQKQNCFLVENGNYPALGKLLERITDGWQSDCHRYDPVIINGIETARQFQDLAKEGESLKQFFGSR